jgi:methionyl-tRNA formyltransferase
MTRAVVFAYHNVGVRCLSVLLAHGVEVALVVTHRDSPGETIWFDSVADLARLNNLTVITPDDPNTPAVRAELAAARPDFIFSFYYRHMIRPEVLELAPRGAYNMHGSLLPKYRGRVPVNWAIIHGERETGATLHRMVEKPDAGEVVAQQAVPILPDDSAREVFHKVTVAAELALDRILPALIGGTAPHVAQNLSRGSYFGGRRPEDGRIDWSQPARTIHNLVRAVAPPYPGAWFEFMGMHSRLLQTQVSAACGAARPQAQLLREGDRLLAHCTDGGTLRLIDFECGGIALEAVSFAQRFGRGPHALH